MQGPSGGAESSSVDPAASAKPGNLEIRTLYLAWCQSREPPRKRKRDAFQLPNKKPHPEVHQTGPALSEPPTLPPEPALISEGLSEPPGISNSDPPRPDLQVWPSKVEETSEETPLVKPRKRAKTGPGSSFQSGETPRVFDRRVKDPGKLLPEERTQMLEKAGEAQMVALTMVYQDGTTQLDPEQKPPPPVCGLLVLMKSEAPCDPPEDSLGPNDDLIHLKLEHTPLWAQQPAHHTQELFTREMLLRILSRSQPVVCYKAKDFLRTALQFDRQNLDWNHVAGVRIHDPQVSGWLLDPADPWSDFRGLLQKHCETGSRTPAPGVPKVSHIISDLCWLYKLNMKLCSKLQSRGLWRLFSDMELKMIPVLAAMESHHIHVDKEALRRTSDLLGAKMKQLEQEAHRAAGQIFLVTSSSQLRTVLFEKLRLHERCESKKLPKTFKQQQSTSEAALLLLQDLHPLPKIILEHRQVHKIKSTFVDGILSCIRSKNYISSTWHQTSAVTGRISSKQPNFQALPRQPLQVRKKQHVHGKEEEVVTVHPRAMFIPQEGWTFLSADFCQVELRLLAHLSSDPELLRIFSDPQADVFSMLASQWKGMSVGEVTSEDREHAKRIVYSVVYGAGRERLSGILGVSAEQASRFQDGFLQKYKDVQAFVQRTIQQSHKQGYVLSIMGRRRTLPNIDSPDWGLRMQAERQAVNFVVQGSAADLCKMAMIQIFNLVSSSSSPSARLLAQLHDELLYEVEDSQVEPFAALVRSTMESLQHIEHLGVHLKVPLKVSVSSGKSWGSMSELLPPS
ncbi:DNA polymerase nu [Menidia menidia]